MSATESEKYINSVNSHFFFDEFTFSNTEFVNQNSNQQLEFADHIIWLDYLLFIIQIKERRITENSSSEKWFNNKILNKAVKQVKSTHFYLDQLADINIENNKGHKRNLSEAKDSQRINLIVYFPGEKFQDELRQKKFYLSTEIGNIHLLHKEDYQWICRYLITPSEVSEYFAFRENLFVKHGILIDQLPEQYVLGHFLETLDIDVLNARYIKNLDKVNLSNHTFDISYLIDHFNESVINKKYPTEYYPIIQEIALLNRSYLKEFKIRFERTIEMIKDGKDVLPFRFYSEKTDCSFVFIPISTDLRMHWENMLGNMTYAHKYDMKSQRAVGVTMFYSAEKEINMRWCYLEFQHEFNFKIDYLLRTSNPFREVKGKEINNRYGV